MQEELSPGWDFLDQVECRVYDLDTVRAGMIYLPDGYRYLRLPPDVPERHPLFPRAVMHELTHFTWLDRYPFHLPGGTHRACNPSTAELAFSEGWANAVACIVPYDKPDGCILEFGGYTMEHNMVDGVCWIVIDTMRHEESIGRFFYDLLDNDSLSSGDDGLHLPYSHFHNIFSEATQEDTLDILDFFDLWKPTYDLLNDNQKGEACVIRESQILPQFPVSKASFSDWCPSVGVDDREEREDLLPQAFAVRQNYPNPFNDCTRLFVEAPRSGNLQVTVYNILGQVVRGEHHVVEPGYHVFEINMENQASGVYFLRATFDNESTTTIKMMYLK